MSQLSVLLRDEVYALQAQGKIDALNDICRRSLQAARHSDDVEAEAMALMGWAMARRLRGESYAASVLMQGAMESAQASGNPYLTCDIFVERGHQYRTLDFNYQQARTHYAQALMIAQEAAYDYGMAAARCGLAECESDYRQFNRAYTLAGSVIAQAMRFDDAYLEACGYIAQGRALIGMDQPNEALDALRQAQEIAEEEEYPLVHAIAAYHAGVLFSQASDLYEQALTTLDAARQISVHTDFAYGEFLALYGLALTHDRHQAYEKALESSDIMQALADETSNDAYRSAAYLSSAASHYTQSNYAQAEQAVQAAIKVTHQTTELPYLYATALLWQARIARARGQYQSAYDVAGQALAAFNAQDDGQAAWDAVHLMASVFLRAWWQRIMGWLGMNSDAGDDDSGEGA